MDAIGVQYTKAADPLAAISDADKKVAVISATPANLKTLAGSMDKLQAFWNRGGYDRLAWPDARRVWPTTTRSSAWIM